LKLTSAAIIRGVVRTARLDPLRPRLEHPLHPSPRKPAGGPHAPQADEIAGSGPGHEHRAAVRELPNPIAACCES
jgi:hypothetical protein